MQKKEEHEIKRSQSQITSWKMTKKQQHEIMKNTLCIEMSIYLYVLSYLVDFSFILIICLGFCRRFFSVCSLFFVRLPSIHSGLFAVLGIRLWPYKNKRLLRLFVYLIFLFVPFFPLLRALLYIICGSCAFSILWLNVFVCVCVFRGECLENIRTLIWIKMVISMTFVL